MKKKTINVAHVRYIGDDNFIEYREFDYVNYISSPRWVVFTWKDKPEVIALNSSQIAEIISTTEVEYEK